MLTSILLPSYSRPAMLNATLQSYFDTCGNNEVEVVIVTDDILSHNVAYEWQYHTTYNGLFRVRAFHNPTRVGAIVAWNQALKQSTGDILFPSGDDQIGYPNWLDLALKCHAEKLNGYGCVGLNDLMHEPQGNGEPVVMTTLLFDRKFCKDVFGGVVCIPHYKYLWVDVELNERARAARKLVWCKEFIVEHRHSANNKRPFDDIDREKAGDAMYYHDRAMFETRKALGFPDDFEAVINSQK